MNEQTQLALESRLASLNQALEYARDELHRYETSASEKRQTIAYIEDCKRQIEEDCPTRREDLHPADR